MAAHIEKLSKEALAVLGRAPAWRQMEDGESSINHRGITNRDCRDIPIEPDASCLNLLAIYLPLLDSI